MSTACPIWRGYLSSIDSRWNVLSETTDDRTHEEIETIRLNTSRYSSVSCYLLDSSERFNDMNFNIDNEVYQTLINNSLYNIIFSFLIFFSYLDCPSTLAKHFAHLFLRDPLYVTDEQVCPKDDPSIIYGFEV